MDERKLKKTKIADLVPDNLNANKGTEYGQHLIEKSLRELGAGRSILLDKNNRIIAGNKTVENAASIGLDDVLIVETDGKQIVAVKRIDIDLDTEQGRKMAIADNSTSKANLEWDKEVIDKIEKDWKIDTKDWGVSVPKLDIESFFDESEQIEEKEKKPVYCPHCGKNINELPEK